MVLFDSHAHLDDPRFQGELDAVLVRAHGAGVAHILAVGADLEAWEKTIAIAQTREGVCAAIGCHPHDARRFTEAEAERLRMFACQPRVVAIGEIGLDYHYESSPRADQRRALIAQLEIARRLDLPVILHIREAMADMLAVLRDFAGRLRGVAHCFSGDAAAAEALVALGYAISFAGNLTFPKASALRQVAQSVPASHLLIETDCPYLAPQPVRGQRNEPAFVRYTACELASLRGVAVEELASHTTDNARKLFAV